jgi:hypothetical protein
MLFAKSNEYKRRLEICRTCKFFESSTQSCGPLIVGGEVDAEGNVFETKYEVLFRRKSIQLCGCVMPIKAKLAFASCPASKWDGVLSMDEQIEFKRFLLDMKAQGRLEQNDMLKFYSFKDKATGAFNERSTCPPCVKKDINTFLESMNNVDVDLNK